MLFCITTTVLLKSSYFSSLRRKWRRYITHRYQKHHLRQFFIIIVSPNTKNYNVNFIDFKILQQMADDSFIKNLRAKAQSFIEQLIEYRESSGKIINFCLYLWTIPPISSLVQISHRLQHVMKIPLQLLLSLTPMTVTSRLFSHLRLNIFIIRTAR